MTNKTIQGQARTVRELLKNKFKVDYYQREYKWETKQINELIDDLVDKFQESYTPGDPRQKVKEYGHYFLGSVIISQKDNNQFIVDGQQRLTSLTLLLIYLSRAQRELFTDNHVDVDELVFSQQYGEKSFNLEVPARAEVMEALFTQKPLVTAPTDESAQTMLDRYADIEANFPLEDMRDALLHFIDWLIENVHLVEITAYSDDDAYTIFETMNDRGLSLAPSEMLKGYLLANITDVTKKNKANALWRERARDCSDVGKETEADFLKAWLRSQYAIKIREKKKGAKPEDFDRIGTEFHRWVREHASAKDGDRLTLTTSDDFYNFITEDMNVFALHYLKLMQASQNMVPGYEAVYRLAKTGMTLQYMVMLAPVRLDDTADVALRKIQLVANYLEWWWAVRVWNYRTLGYSSISYTLFILMRELRGLSVEELRDRLAANAAQIPENFRSNDVLRLHQQNRTTIQLLLARMTDWVEQESGLPSRYVDYVTGKGKQKFEIEHIIADKPQRFADVFRSPAEFREFRNEIGGLLLLQKPNNASLSDLVYEEKIKHYPKQNLLAASLHESAYTRFPGFAQFRKISGLPFQSYEVFGRAEMTERNELYRQIAELVWRPVLNLD